MRTRPFTLLLRTLTIALLTALGLGLPAFAQNPPTPAPAPAEKTRDNILILLDASGSMREPLPGANQSKMDAAKTAILSVASGVSPGTNVGVLVFSGRGAANEWVYPLGPVDKDKLRLALAPIQPDGGTPLGAYIKKAGDALLERRKAQTGYGTFRLLVVTDGEAGDPALVERYTPDVMSRGIIVDVIGVNMKSAHTLARKVHLYKRANEAAELNSALTEVFAELSTPAGGGKDDHSAESFDIIRALPDNFAPAALAALTAPRDQPIGEQPATPGASTPPPPPPQASNPPPSSGPAPTSQPSLIGLRWSPCCIIVAVVFLIVFIKGIRKVGGGRK